MYGRIADLAEGLITQDVEHSKPAVASPWRNLGLHTIGFGQSMDIRCARRIMTLIIPSEHPAKPPPQRKQRSNRDVRRRPPVAKHESTDVLHGPTGPAVVEWNRPHVVQRHIAQKRVAAQVKSSEVRRIDTHNYAGGTRCDSFSGLLTA